MDIEITATELSELSPDEYILIEETFAPEALQIIGDWILLR